MLETLFHMSFAFVVFAGVVYFSIFSWLKMQQEKDVVDSHSEGLRHQLKRDMERPFGIQAH